MSSKNIFLTGEIQIGKSTAISKFLKENLSGADVLAGFKTKPFYEEGVLKGYYIENQIEPIKVNTLENIVGINQASGFGKSCKGITETFETIGVQILEDSLKITNSIIIMDELGFFEKEAVNFQREVHKVLNSPHRVIGVLKAKRNEFLDSIQNREDVVVIEVTLENRDTIIEKIQKYWEC